MSEIIIHNPDKCKGCRWESEIPNDYKVYNNDNFVANHSTQPVTLGHIIVMLKKMDNNTPRSIALLNHDLHTKCYELVYNIAQALPEIVERIRGLRVERVYVASFSEDTDWHPHVHIIPRTMNIQTKDRGQYIFNRVLDYLPLSDVKLFVGQVKDKLGIS